MANVFQDVIRFFDSEAAIIAKMKNGMFGATDDTNKIVVKKKSDGTGRFWSDDSKQALLAVANTFTAANTFNALTTFNGSLNVSDILIVDNITDAFRVREGSNEYINIKTTNGSQEMFFGNPTDNPKLTLLGSGEVTFNGDLRFAFPTFDMLLRAETISGGIALQTQQSGASTIFTVFTKDGLGNDDVGLELFLKGLPGNTTNRERLIFAGDSGNNRFVIRTENGGTGTLRDLHLGTGIRFNQLVLTSDGTNTMSGTLDVDGSLEVGSPADGGSLFLEGNSGKAKTIFFRTGALIRWNIASNTTAESGSDVGSDFEIVRRNDAGSPIGDSIFIKRDTGNIDFGAAVDTNPIITHQGLSPLYRLSNKTPENIEGGRESVLQFAGQKLDTTFHALAQIEGSHDGTGDDEKGCLIFRTNDGSDGFSLTRALTISSTQKATFAGELDCEEDIKTRDGKSIMFGDSDVFSMGYILASDALVLKAGAVDYLNIDITGASEEMFFGNPTDNNKFTFLGSGTAKFNGTVHMANAGIDSIIKFENSNNENGFILYSGTDFDFFANSGAVSTFSITGGAPGNVGVAITAPTGQLHVDQPSASGAKPVLRLDQGDIDDTFIDFIGTSAADGSRSISSDTTEDAAKFGAFRVEINGVVKWVRVYDDES